MRKVHVAIWGVHQMIMFGHLGGGGSKISKNWPHGLRMTPYYLYNRTDRYLL